MIYTVPSRKTPQEIVGYFFTTADVMQISSNFICMEKSKLGTPKNQLSGVGLLLEAARAKVVGENPSSPKKCSPFLFSPFLLNTTPITLIQIFPLHGRTEVHFAPR